MRAADLTEDLNSVWLGAIILCADKIGLGSMMGVAYSQDLRERVMAAVDGTPLECANYLANSGYRRQ